MKTDKLIDGIGDMDPVYLDEYYDNSNRQKRGTAWKAALIAAVIAVAAVCVLVAVSPFSKRDEKQPENGALPAVSDTEEGSGARPGGKDGPAQREVILSGDVTPDSAIYGIDGNTPKNGQTVIYDDLQWYFENGGYSDAVYGVLIIPSTDAYVDLYNKAEAERMAKYPPRIQELMDRYQEVEKKMVGETDVKKREELAARYHELWMEIQGVTDEYTKSGYDDCKRLYETEYPAVIELAVRRLEESGVEIKARESGLHYWGGHLSYLYAELTEEEILSLRYDDLGLTVCLASTAEAYENPVPDIRDQ